MEKVKRATSVQLHFFSARRRTNPFGIAEARRKTRGSQSIENFEELVIRS